MQAKPKGAYGMATWAVDGGAATRVKRDSKEISEANTATMEACTIAKVQQTDAMDKQVDELLDWVDGIDVDSDEEVEKYDLETLKQGGRS